MQNFNALRNLLMEAQQPMLIVLGLHERECTGDFVDYNHIIIPDKGGIISFDYRGGYDALYGIGSSAVSFKKAISMYAEKVIECPGSKLEVFGL